MDYGAFAEIKISAAANSAEVPVPGAFLNTVFKSGSNEIHGELYQDFENKSFQGNNISESLRDRGITEGDKFNKYYDQNFNIGGPFQKDKFWWFTSLRNQYSELRTELRQNNGSPGGIFSTRLQNVTIKLNYQLNTRNQISFSSQGGRKFQPFRGGQGSSAQFYIVDSTYNQDSYSWVGKVQWTSVLSNRATLDSSVNHFGYHFPGRARIQATPTFDDVTQFRRGGYPSPFRDIDRRYHANSNLSYFKDNFLGGSHDMKIGYALLYYANIDTDKGAPGTPGLTPGHVRLVYSNGAPNEIDVYNTPVVRRNSSELQNSVFFQDKWQIGRRLTLNLGVRYDRYNSYYPPQGNPGVGPFATKTNYPKTTIAVFNNVVPRLAFVYDPFGNTKTAFKVSYGRYAENVGVSLASQANPNRQETRTYAWDGTLPITLDLVSRLRLLSVSGQLSQIRIDPNLNNSYTDEYTAGIEHQIFTDFGLSANFVRKIRHNPWGSVNEAQPTSGFVPATYTDPGRDGRNGTADDKPITLFNRVVGPDIRNFLSNFDYGDNFSTFEFSATKRMSKNWQLISGFDWTKRNLGSSITNDPNTKLYGSDARDHTRLWTYKLLGTYVLPKGLLVSATYNAQKGESYGRRIRVRLPQGTNSNIYAEPDGSFYLPTTHLTNIRIEKSFRLGEHHKIAGMFDLFNVPNRNTVVGINTLTGTTTDRKGNSVSTFGRTTQILNPRIFRLGARWTF